MHILSFDLLTVRLSVWAPPLYARAVLRWKWWPSADKSNAPQLTKAPQLDPTIRLIFPRSEAWNPNRVVVLGSIRHRCLLPCCGRVDCKTVKRSPGIRDDLEAKDVVHARGSNGWRWWPCLEEKKTSGMCHVTAVALAYACCYVVWIVQTIEGVEEVENAMSGGITVCRSLGSNGPHETPWDLGCLNFIWPIPLPSMHCSTSPFCKLHHSSQFYVSNLPIDWPFVLQSPMERLQKTRPRWAWVFWTWSNQRATSGKCDRIILLVSSTVDGADAIIS